MTKKAKTETVAENTEAPVEDNRSPSDKLFEGVTGKDYVRTLVIGVLPDGRLDVNTTHPSFQEVHYLLNKTVLEMLLIEREMVSKTEETKGETS